MKRRPATLGALVALSSLATVGAVQPATAKPAPTFSAMLSHDSSCVLTLEAKWSGAQVAQVYVMWKQDGVYRFTSAAPGTGPNGGTLRGRTAVMKAGPLADTGTIHEWTAQVDFYSAAGANLASFDSNADLTTCGLTTAP